MSHRHALSHPGRSQSRRALALGALVWFVAIPYALINLPWPVWEGRFWAIACFIIPATAIILLAGLGRSVLIWGAPSSAPRKDVPPIIVVGLRLVMLAVGVWFAYKFTIPFLRDGIALIASGGPVQIDGTIRSQYVGFRSPWFIERAVRFLPDGDSTTREYVLYFSVRRLDAGRYTLTVLPSSHLILDVTPRG